MHLQVVLRKKKSYMNTSLAYRHQSNGACMCAFWMASKIQCNGGNFVWTTRRIRTGPHRQVFLHCVFSRVCSLRTCQRSTSAARDQEWSRCRTGKAAWCQAQTPGRLNQKESMTHYHACSLLILTQRFPPPPHYSPVWMVSGCCCSFIGPTDADAVRRKVIWISEHHHQETIRSMSVLIYSTCS